MCKIKKITNNIFLALMCLILSLQHAAAEVVTAVFVVVAVAVVAVAVSLFAAIVASLPFTFFSISFFAVFQ